MVAGKQKVALKTQDDKAVVYDCYGNTLPAGTKDGQIVVEVTDTPIYVTGTVVSAIADRQSVELKTPQGQKVATFTDAGQVKVIEAPARVPRRVSVTPVLQGKYRAAIANVDGRRALQIELLDDNDPRKLLPRYGEFELAKPITLPGRPFALNVHAKGNGGWGKLVLALTDAKGHKFTSLGEGHAANRGLPYVAFDGWHTMQILLPGQFRADESMRWPANRDWGAWGKVA